MGKKMKIGAKFDELPRTSRPGKYAKMKALMDANPDVWILLADDNTRSFSLSSASKRWDGKYVFAERTIESVKYLFGKKEA